MSIVRLYEEFGGLLVFVSLAIASFNLAILWKLKTNDHPHLWEAVQRIADKLGVDIRDLRG